MGIVFVAGVHAVGKTTACKYIEKTLGAIIYSASALIKEENKGIIYGDNKIVFDLMGNQGFLIRAVKKKLKLYKNFILDGHFTLIQNSGVVQNVPIEVFSNLPIDLIVLCYDSPINISERSCARDKVALSVEFIEKMQNLEIDHAKMVSNKLNIPLEMINPFDTEVLGRIFKSWTAKFNRF